MGKLVPLGKDKKEKVDIKSILFEVDATKDILYVIYGVKSESSPELHYQVKYDQTQFSCNCPQFYNRKKECKHIKRVKEFRKIPE